MSYYGIYTSPTLYAMPCASLMKRRSPYGQYWIGTRWSSDITELNSDQGFTREFLGKQYLSRLECLEMIQGRAVDFKQ